MKLKRWLLWGALVVFLFVFTIRVVWVNTTYPEPSKYIVAVGETVTGPYGLKYTIQDAEFLSEDEVGALYDAIDPERTKYTRSPASGVLIELSILNPTQEEQRINVPSNLESNAWKNGLAVPIYYYLNQNIVESNTIKPGETVIVKLPFTAALLSFPSEQIPTLCERKYYLVVSLTPEVVKMELPYIGDK